MYHPDKVKSTANRNDPGKIRSNNKGLQIPHRPHQLGTLRQPRWSSGNDNRYRSAPMDRREQEQCMGTRRLRLVLWRCSIRWFGSREMTNDGIHARSAAEFFKSLREDSGADQVFGTLGKSFSWEHSTLLPHAQNGRQTTQFGQR